VDAETCNRLAWRYLQAGETRLALEHARRAHELSRRNLDYLNTFGVALGESGQLEEAEAAFRRALKLKPVHVDALVNLAKTLEKREQLAEAAKLYERALALAPRTPKLGANLAAVYRQLGDAVRARDILQRCAAGEDLAMGLAECDLEEGRVASALERLAQAVAAHPEWVMARVSYAHLLLATGRRGEAWEHYLWRGFAAPANAGRRLPARLDGRRIRLLNEQGIGDILFFLRFVPQLRARGAEVSLDCPEKLRPLLGASGLLAAGPVDEQFPIGDLPALLGADDAPPAWPLAVAAEDARAAGERLAALGPGPWLAVTWRAGTDAARGREFGAERSLLSKAAPPAALGGALRGWRGSVLLLQRGAREGEAAAFAAALQAPAHDLSALGDDLRALAATLAAVDEYVAVSNTNVHLRAGLGRRARVLVPQPPEWRWLHEGESPWFPGFPVYRQPQDRNWDGPLRLLREDLFP
jgi:tetratricopeptide (TPR) repeat protein